MTRKKTDLRKLLIELEALPKASRDGVARFLELVLTVDRALKAENLRPEDVSFDDDPAFAQGSASLEEILALFNRLCKGFQNQEPARRDLVVAVLASAWRARELGQDDSGKLLLQLAIIMTAGDEQAVSAEVQDIVIAAGVAITKSQSR